MSKITFLVIILIVSCSAIQAGFLRSQLAYNAGFPIHPSPQFAAGHSYGSPFSAGFGSTYAAHLAVAPLSGHHSYANLGYAATPFVKFRSSGGGFGFSPFAYASARSHHKFAFPAPVPSIYNAPPPVDFGTPNVGYSGFESPNTVVKFGPPITTTTTTTYSSTAAAAVGVPLTNPLSAVAGW